VVQHQRHGNLNEDPYFSTNLYSYFSLAVAQVKRDDYFKPRTRFYAHSPSFWAIVIDDRIFAEPYTFGSSVSSAEQVLGGQLPLLVYDRGLNAKTFDSYASHIHRLWITSETDLYNVRSRETDRQRIMQEMFEKRGRWLTEVCHMLHTPKRNNRGELLPVETDQRRSPRRRCEHEQQFTIKWRDDKKQPRSIVTRVVDSSYHGLRLSTSAGSPPPETEVEIIGQGRGTLAAAEAMIGQMFERPRSWKVARLVPVNERITSNEEFAIYAEGV
jgi:hypothetical protein